MNSGEKGHYTLPILHRMCNIIFKNDKKNLLFFTEVGQGVLQKPLAKEIDEYKVKPVLSGHSKIDETKILITYGSLMKVESIAECSP